MTAAAGPASVDQPVRAVLLDALGTLLELDPPAPRLRRQLAQRFGIEISETLAQRAIAAEIAYYRAHLDQGRDERSLRRLRWQCAEVIGQQLAPELSAPPPGPGELVDALLASLQFIAFADARPALRALRRAGLRLVVVSNWDVSLHAVLERLGLAAGLDSILTSAEVGARKPAREIFQRALAVAGVEAAAARHVGDSLKEDVAGARRAGIEPILIRRDGAGGPEGVPAISSLAELPGVLERHPE